MLEDARRRCFAASGPRPGAEHVVRSAARLAKQLDVEWTAVYVETPRLQRLPPQERERILNVVKLAQELGAKTAILTGNDPCAQAIVDYARTHNISTLVVGRAAAAARWPLGARIERRRRRARARHRRDRDRPRRAPATDQIRGVDAADAGEDPRRGEKRMRYVWTVARAPRDDAGRERLCCRYFELANIVMLFLLTVVLVAVQWGRGPAIVAAFVNVARFDFFFVPPRFSFAVTDIQYLLTFAVMLAVALITGQLTRACASRRASPSHREERARTLYEFARDLSQPAARPTQVIERPRTSSWRATSARAWRCWCPMHTERSAVAHGPRHDQSVRQHRRAVGLSTRRSRPARAPTRSPDNEYLFLPLQVADAHARRAGACRPERTRDLFMVPEQRHQFEIFARSGRDGARARALRRRRATGAHPDGVRAFAQFAARGAFARSAHAAGGLVGLAESLELTQTRALRDCSARPRRRSPRKRAG